MLIVACYDKGADMFELLRSLWNSLAACFRLELDAEIDRQIERHDQAHPVISAPILISFNMGMPNNFPVRRNAVSDLTDVINQLRMGSP